MDRRTFTQSLAILTGASMFPSIKTIAGSLNYKAYNLRMLRNNVGIFTERGGSIGFLFDKEGIVVIDSQFADTAPHLIEEAKKQNDLPFRYLLNTHHHGDHTGGNISFKGIAEHVVSHENCLKNLKANAEKNNSVEKQLFPDATFSDDWKTKIGNEKIKAQYFGPGHTNGDAVYHFENANIMHVGDLMFNKRHPFVDRSTGANIQNWIVALAGIIKKGDKDTIYIFGHSLNPGEETGSSEDLKKFSDYLEKTLAFARSEFEKGTTKADFIKSTSIPGVTDWSGQGIERPLTAAYEEVEAQKKA